jgi:hypothetical protein
MKKVLWRLLVVAIIVLAVLRYRGDVGVDTLVNDTADVINTTTTWDTEEVTEDDLKMIENFLDEIIDAVEEEENK